MKQKNLILMAVAVGCGLVAAFLTSQMSGKTAAPEQVEVIVTSKDLPIGTQLSKDEISKSITRTKMARDAVPAGVVESEDELTDLRLTRSFTKGEVIKKGELTKFGVIQIPDGKRMVSLQMNVAQAAAGFVVPGTRVDIQGSMPLKNNKRMAVMILSDVLVLAVDGSTSPPKEGGAYQSINTVSFAVTKKEADLLSLATDRGCQMRLTLRRSTDLGPDPSYNMERVFDLMTNPEGDPGMTPGEGEKPKPTEIVKVPVTNVDLPPDTQLTPELLTDGKTFGLAELPKDSPAARIAIQELTPHTGKYLKYGLLKGQWVSPELLADAPQARAKQPETTPGKPPEATAPVAPTPTPVKRRYHDVTVTTASGIRVYRYEEIRPGEWRLLGEISQGRED